MMSEEQTRERESNSLREFITKLGFELKNGSNNIYQKHYSKCNKTLEIELKSDISKSIIHYQNIGITRGRATTCDFHQEENKVVLECVNRLLDIGYLPKDIILEKKYEHGRQSEDWMDVVVMQNNKVYAIIECKKDINEYTKEWNKTKQNGGQLFKYFQQDNDAKLLILYVSEIKNDKIEYHNKIIKTDDFRNEPNVEKKFEKWNKTAEECGFFNSIPYTQIENDAIIKGSENDLIPITLTDINPLNKKDKKAKETIYNKFAEIIRRNAISDKSNAYNKIFNLFVCKIIDEETTKDGEEYKFQWKNGEKAEDVLDRLSLLYKEGMDKYIGLKITDYSWEEFSKDFKEDNLEEGRKKYIALRFYKNNEFAFQEVINEETFIKNSKIVKEVVELLQKYQIKYANKQQFLGYFFEKLLNIGVKQDEGQFFTPIPIARFMNYCIPYNHIIDDNIKNDNQDFIPKVIDYSCGAGHFLTEAMDRIQNYIDTIDKTKQGNKIKSQLNIWQKDEDGVVLKWADRFIFGIEKDYRLAKTTKIACFMNGDGEANILPADGLASFDSQEYKGKIQAESFDVIVANPPFSVDDFKLAEGNNYQKDFPELYNRLGENSDDIECLFIERTKQLLKEGGCCAVILPSSILESGGVFTATRKMFLKYFDLIGIQELKSKNVFMATNTETIILFAKKHDKTKEYKEIEKFIKDKFIQSQQDFSYNNNEKVIEKFCKKTDKTKAELLELLNNKKTQNDALEKLVIFISNYNKKCIISTFDGYSEKGKIGKQFLGFVHSERKKYEGIRPFPDNEDGVIRSQLYTDENVFDDKKVNYYFYKAFLGEFPEVHDNLKSNVFYKNIENVIAFDKIVEKDGFQCEWRTKTIEIDDDYKYKTIRIKSGDNFEIKKGQSITEEQVIDGEIPVIAGGRTPAYYHNKANRTGETICISSSGSAGYVSYWDKPIWASDCFTIKSKNKDILTKYIYYFLKSKEDILMSLKHGLGTGHFYDEDLTQYILFPLVSVDIQKQILDDIEKIEQQEKSIERERLLQIMTKFLK